MALGSRRITLSLSYNWLGIIFLVAIFLIACFTFGPDPWKPSLIFATAVLGGIGALIAALNALESRAAQVHQNKMATAIRFIERWNAPDFSDTKKGGREVVYKLKELRTDQQLTDYFAEDSNRLRHLIDILNVFECLAVAVQTDTADEETTKRFFRTMVQEYWIATKQYVELRRRDTTKPRIFREIEALYELWKEG